jgi:hypothetical protein
MKIVQGDQQPIVEDGPGIRDVSTGRQTILTGDPGTPGYFLFRIFYQKGEYNTPRHRHPFDQWRYQIEGDCGYAGGAMMKPGMIGYFPECAYYGPQHADESNLTVIVQFGGPSGNGYLSAAQEAAAIEEMKTFGRFEDGVFYRNAGVEGRPAVEAFQATWEHAYRRPMVLEPAQYADPILLDTEAYRWMPVDGSPGVEQKLFGTFTDCDIRAARYKLDPGATLRVTGRGTFLVLAGHGSLEDQPYRKLTGLYLESEERASFHAAETTDILLLGLPEIARMHRPRTDGYAEGANAARTLSVAGMPRS